MSGAVGGVLELDFHDFTSYNGKRASSNLTCGINCTAAGFLAANKATMAMNLEDATATG